MPNKEAAKKALRQNERRARRNQLVKAEIKSLRIKLRKMIDAKEIEKGKELAQQIAKKLDKAVGKKVFKQNTVARYKSRMMKKLNALGKK